MGIIKKIRILLMDRFQQFDTQNQFDKTENFTDIKEKIDCLDRKLNALKNMLRSSDDQLLIMLFEAQESWHNEVIRLANTQEKLTKTIVELKETIRKHHVSYVLED